MKKLHNVVLISIMFTLYGCDSMPKFDEVMPDKRTAYLKSRSLPALEVPPDLIINTNDNMSIPSDAEATSLNEFQRQRALNRSISSNALLGVGEEEGEQWILLQGNPLDIWSKLRTFWKAQGFGLDLDDLELGVLETEWKPRENAEGTLRDRFKVLTEPDETGNIVLFLSSEKQMGSEGEWFDTESDAEYDKEMVRALKLHFYGQSTVASENKNTASSQPSKLRAEILRVEDNKDYLTIPEEFRFAWRDTKTILQHAGYPIQNSNPEKGTFAFLYYPPKDTQKKGFVSKLKFWDSDDEDSGIPYQLSLTSVGDKTEIIVMNEKGKWETNEDTKRILSKLQSLYNNL